MSVSIVLLIWMLMMLLQPQSILSARIIMTSAQAPSHVLMQLSVGEELVRRGHEVHIAVGSRYPKQESIRQLGVQPETFHVPSDVLFMASDEGEKLLTEMLFNESSSIKDPSKAAEITNRDCASMFSDNSFMERMRRLRFDLAIVEPFIVSPCSLLLPHQLRVPFVSMSVGLSPWHFRVPALPSFFALPSPWSKPLTDKTSFLGTVVSLFGYLAVNSLTSCIWNTTLLQLYAPDVASWNDLILRSELFLTDNDHYILSPMPLFPNVISASGLTARPPVALPGDLERIFAASDAVILLTFGTMANRMPTNIVHKFFDAFRLLQPLTIVARLTVPDGLQVPDNVHIRSWLPQNDILGHPRTRLFITHCGANGLHEALYHGVPIVGFPMFAEQTHNCPAAVQKGFGLEMDIHDFTAEQLFENIRQVLRNDSYVTAVRRMSAAWRDEPMIGSEKAAFWIEHVIKHGGRHLRPVSADMPLYRFLMLDVIGTVFLLLFVVGVLLLAGCVFVVRKCLSKRATQSSVTAVRKQQ